MEEFGLCTTKIPFLDEKCIWIVTLDDHTVVYQDDSNPSLGEHLHHSAWVRLANYLEYSGWDIKSWKLQFRDNIVELPVGVGQVYSRGVIGTMSGGENSTFHYHIVGAIQAERVEDSGLSAVPNRNATEVERFWYHSPALVCTDKKITKLSELDPQVIIWNNHN